MTTRIFLATIAIAICISAASAQGSKDFHKWEVSGGYSNMRAESTVGTETIPQGPTSVTVDPCSAAGASFFGSQLQKFFCDRRGFNGFDTSVAFNFRRYVGIKGNVSGHFNSETFVDTAPPTTNETRSR